MRWKPNPKQIGSCGVLCCFKKKGMAVFPFEGTNLRKLVAMSSGLLPTEIVTNILSRLPVKTLSRFRCVSKAWCCLIKDPYFIKLHLDRADPIVMLRFRDLFSIQPNNNNNNSDSLVHEAQKVDYPYRTPLFRVEILGSCNGLVLIQPDEDVYCIWNPTTQEFIKLPQTPIDTKPRPMPLVSTTYHGFGYDHTSKDYKVVRIITFNDGRSEVKVYTLGTNSWTRVDDVPCFILPLRDPGVLLNGGLHWVATPEPMIHVNGGFPKIITSFDLADERFKEVPQHVYDFQDNNFDRKLGVLGGCLCALDDFHEAQLQVWVMTDYGVKESWTKLFSFSDPVSIASFQYLKPSCKFHLEKMDEQKHLVLYDFNSEMIQTVQIPDIYMWSKPEILIPGKSMWCESETYVQSLVSLNTGNYVWQEQAKGRTRKRKNRCDVD